MKSIGFIRPTYPDEKRVALFPSDVSTDFKFSKIYIEKGFGLFCGIPDSEYEASGCIVTDRNSVFAQSDIVFSLKLIQKDDYSKLRNGQIVLGWTHPNGSGKQFFDTICQDKKLIVIDIDSTAPKIYFGHESKLIDEIDVGFCSENSYIAGICSVFHALVSYGSFVDTQKKVCVLSSGNVAQGSFNALAKMGFSPKMFYRKTMQSFYETMGDYDIIVNGIETTGDHIVSCGDAQKLKRGCLIIDAAADAGGAIEFTSFTSHSSPISKYQHVSFYCVNNSPSLAYRDVSPILSRIFSKYIFNLDFCKILEKYIGD